MKDLLTYSCDYNIWANEKLADFFVEKPEELLARPIENSFPSIRKTLIHILSAEKSWLARLAEQPSNNKRVVDEFTNTAAAFNALVIGSKNFAQFVHQQPDSFFDTPVVYHTWDGTKWEMLPKIMIQHCMNHSTYHRGQLVTLARQLGMRKGVPSTDLLYYSRAIS